jgi:predicted membrane-bound spermidine synthase
MARSVLSSGCLQRSQDNAMRDFRVTPSPSAYFALFAVSGFAGLMYESIWTHYLKLFLGHAAYAQTLVLAIFMGGMALGSWLAGAYSTRMRNLLLGYAIVEALVGVAALSFHVVFVGATNYAYDTVLPSLSSPAAAQLVKWTLGALFILPQSVMLGMTFPLMSGSVIRRYPGTPGHTLASLYFSNSIGAAAGVLASGFLFIGLVGLPGTMLTAGLLNLLLALILWLLAKGGEPALAPAPTQAPWARDPWVKLLLLAAAVTGAASFLYEIAWIRMLSLVLGGSTHSFELMLAAFILGLALGGWYVRRRIQRLANPTRFLAYAQLLMGGFALATLPVYGQSFEWMSFLLRALARTDQGYTLFIVASSVIALLIMLPATFVAGTTLPLLTFVLFNRGHGERTIGSVYAANTIGAILGVLAAVHLLMPALGVKGVVVMGAALDLALGVALLALAVPAGRRLELTFGAAAASFAVTIAVLAVQLDPMKMVSGVYRTGVARKTSEAQVVFLRDGKTASIALLGDGKGSLLISTNGKTDAMLRAAHEEASPDEATMVLAGALALAHHPQARTAANIGFGSGLTTHTMLSTPQLERLDTVEIERYMVEAARGFGERVRNAYEDPRSRVHIEDAKTFFSTRSSRYDIIVSEPSNPWVSGVSSLFSDEFYARIRNHLQPNGILVQWIQGYEIELPLVASVLKALDPHFSDYVIYGTNDVDLLIVARRDGMLPPIDDAVLRSPGLAKELARVNVKGVRDLALRRFAGKPVVRGLLATYPVPANSDYFPYLDQNAARARFLNKAAMDELTPLRIDSLPVLEMLERRPAPDGRVAITRDEQFLPAALADDARLTRDAILGRRGWEQVPAATKREWLLASMMLDRCDLRADWHLWRNAVRGVAGFVTPYLAPEETVQILDLLRASPCVARLPKRNAQWLDLLRAVALRDGARMTELAGSMLEASDAEAKTYLLHAAMLGALARQRSDEALAVWQKHGEKLTGAGAAPLALDTRVLVSFAYIEATRQARLDQ